MNDLEPGMLVHLDGRPKRQFIFLRGTFQNEGKMAVLLPVNTIRPGKPATMMVRFDKVRAAALAVVA